ncbi:MAG TPA: GDSL-type esterase/lipase family protein [Acidimicrobiia bacterium]|nr:GDSL-type esterase/lipase family protein [Acidimicrobiia bacterium]
MSRRKYVPPLERGPRRRRRRQRLTFLTTGVLALAAAVLLAFVATDTWRLGHPPEPTVAARATPLPIVDTGGPACRSPLTTTDPLRLWIGGDSLAGSLGPALGTLTAGTGVVAPVYDSRVGSGLSMAGYWQRLAAADLAKYNPEVVVFIIGTNDFMVPQPQPVDASGQPAWKASYGELVAQMLQVLSAGNRYVYWIGAPTLQNPTQDAGVRQINAVARAVVSAQKNATYVDAYQLFSDSQGHFATQLPGPGGKLETMRTDDGIHFTPAGADLLASTVFAPLDKRCRVTPQAMPNSPQQVIAVPGATQVPEGGTGSGSSGGTSPTRPPQTAPPTQATSPSTTPTTTGVTLPVP